MLLIMMSARGGSPGTTVKRASFFNYNQIKRLDVAVGDRVLLEKALQLDPASPTALRQLGELELAAKDIGKAAAHLKRACELRPDDSTAARTRG